MNEGFVDETLGQLWCLESYRSVVIDELVVLHQLLELHKETMQARLELGASNELIEDFRDGLLFAGVDFRK